MSLNLDEKGNPFDQGCCKNITFACCDNMKSLSKLEHKRYSLRTDEIDN